MRQVLDKTHGVADEHARHRLGMECAHGGVEGGKQFVGDQYLATGECSHEGGFARIGVADKRHARDFLSGLTRLSLLSARALCLPLFVHRDNFQLQLGDTIPNFLPVQCAMRLACTATTGTATLASLWPGQLCRFTQPW